MKILILIIAALPMLGCLGASIYAGLKKDDPYTAGFFMLFAIVAGILFAMGVPAILQIN